MAVQNSKTRGASRLILSRAIEGPRAHPLAGHTLTGGSATTFTDTKYANGIYGDDYFNSFEFVNQTKGVTTIVTDWVQSTGVGTVPSGTANAASDVYECHSRSGPTSGAYNDAIDMAVQAAAHNSALADKVSQTLAFQRYRTLYPIPSGFSYLHTLYADMRNVGQYIARHVPSNWDTLTGLRDVTGRTRIAQSFQTKNSNPSFVLGDVFLLLAKVGTPSGGTPSITLTIEADSSGAPSGTALATSAAVTATSPSVEPTFQRFTFAAAPVLTASTTYWIVLQGDYTVSTTNYVAWANDSGGSGYSLGSPSTYDGVSTWTAATGDFIFTVRTPYPDLVPMKPRIHWDVLRDSTRYIYLTERGMEDFGLLDGTVFHLTGQGAPALPTADSSTLEIPYDYCVARAGMHLATEFSDYVGTGVRDKIAAWGRITDDLEKKMSPLVRAGSIPVESL